MTQPGSAGHQRLVGRCCARLSVDIPVRFAPGERTPAAISAHPTHRIGMRLRVGGTRHSEQ